MQTPAQTKIEQFGNVGRHYICMEEERLTLYPKNTISRVRQHVVKLYRWHREEEELCGFSEDISQDAKAWAHMENDQ